MKEFWKGVWTILRREIRSQFSSPMTYIFIVVFLEVSTVLFLFFRAFFMFPTADMTEFFGFIVPVLCVFAPAATMRIWAEDRKENTIEMLLTFPISAPALVLGKFLAALVLYLAALASTLMIPVMLAVLGEPDWGPILSGYFGAVLMGALFLSLGMFVSGFCRDQVTAFVLSFMACAAAALFGWDVFAIRLVDSLGFIGAFLRTMLGMTVHYVPFTRGIIELADVLYFLAWTALFLFLNGVYLEGRSRPWVYVRFAVTVGLALLVGILFNMTVATSSLARFDVTEGRIHTVSDASKRILRSLKIAVQAKVYITPADKMPGELRNLERDVTTKLEEMRVASGGRLQWKVIHMEAANVLREPEIGDGEEEGEEEEKKKSLEERLIDKGVKPFSVRTVREDQATTQFIYSSIGVAYKEKEEEIIPQVLPGVLPELEYRLMNIVFKLMREKEPVVALVAPYEDINIPPQQLQMYMRMGMMPPKRDDPYVYLQRLLEREKFDVRRVRLTKREPLPDEYDTLIVVNPKDLDERQKWEINRALVAGKSVFLAVQNRRWDYSTQRNQPPVTPVDENPGANDFLAGSGVEIADDVLMDENYETLTISDGRDPFGGGSTWPLPMHIAINPGSMNADVSITSRIGRIFYLWGSRVHLDEEKLAENKLEVTTLFSTSDGAWTVPSTSSFSLQATYEQPDETKQYPLAVMVKGQFVDAYAGEDRPAWSRKPPRPGMPPPPPEDDDGEPPQPVEPKPGKLILVGCAEMFTSNFVRGGNLDFFMNSVDALTLGEDLIHIRAKKPIDRTIDKPKAASRAFWKFMDLGFVTILVIAAGATRYLLVRRSRERYAAGLEKKA